MRRGGHSLVSLSLLLFPLLLGPSLSCAGLSSSSQAELGALGLGVAEAASRAAEASRRCAAAPAECDPEEPPCHGWCRADQMCEETNLLVHCVPRPPGDGPDAGPSSLGPRGAP
jgi:hypothetical protein